MELRNHKRYKKIEFIQTRCTRRVIETETQKGYKTMLTNKYDLSEKYLIGNYEKYCNNVDFFD